MCACRIWRIRRRAPLVLAFRAEVARQVRAAEFGDLQGLIQGLSTGIQGELDKRDRREERSPGQVTAGRVLRLAPRPVFLAGREELLAELDARLAGMTTPGRGWWPCAGWAARARPAWRWSTPTASWARSRWPGSCPPRTRRCWRPGSVSWPPSSAPGIAGTRWPGCTGCWPPARRRGCWCSTTRPTGRRWRAFVPPAGPGRVLITSRNQIWPPGQALQVPMLDPQVAAEFLVSRTGDPDRRAALDLAGELGGLPLALEQAAAYVQATGDSLAGYLALFRQRRADMLGRGEPIGYSQTVATTWRLAFEELAAGRTRRGRACCGCWPSARPRRSRCACCCSPAPGSPDDSGLR